MKYLLSLFIIIASHAADPNWDGNYFCEEVGPPGSAALAKNAPAAVWDYEINIKGTTGKLQINGRMTGENLDIKAVPSAESVKLLLVKDIMRTGGDDDSPPRFKTDDHLLTLQKGKKGLTLKFAKIQPNVTPSTITCKKTK